MKPFILLFAIIACLASPLYAVSDITLWLTVDIINASTSDLSLHAKSNSSDLTQIDAVQWAIAYNSAENTPSTSLVNDFASDWTPVISLQPTSIGAFDKMISWMGVGGLDKTIISGSGGTLLSTVRFTKVGTEWGTAHIVTESEDAGFGTIILNNNEQKILSYSIQDVSLPVQMTEITAAVSAGSGIILAWTTESEVNNAGFYVWRSESENGFYQKISTVLISGQRNSSSKTDYRFSDPDAKAGKTYWYKIEAVSTDGRSEFHGPVSVLVREAVPAEFSLSMNFPNPFNPVTEADYELPEASPVLIRVFSMLGAEVAILVDQRKQAGRYTVRWDGTDGHGILVPSGIYFMYLQAGSFISVRKMTYIR
jgi:hypothetical protein